MASPARVSAEDAPLELKVMSFNIRYGNAKDGLNHWLLRRGLVYDVLRTHEPDAVGIQEALRFQLDQIHEAVPGFAEVGVGRDGGESGEYSAILYRTDRFTLIESDTFWLSDTPDKRSTSWGNELHRICTWAHLKDRETGRTFYVFNTHFDHRSAQSRNKSAELISKRVARRSDQDAPFVITGDFNAAEESPAMRVLFDPEPGSLQFVDTFRVLHPEATEVGTTNKWEGRTSGSKIDYVLVAPDTKVIEAAIVQDNKNGRYPSDHYPVKATVRFE